MTKRGSLRRDEQWLADQQRKAGRWKTAPYIDPAPDQRADAGEGIATSFPRRAAAREAPALRAPIPSKMGNEPTDVYDSKREARRARALETMLAGGAIRNLRKQVVYLLIPKQPPDGSQPGERECTYRADFVYEEPRRYPEPGWYEVVEDCKGHRTEAYVIRRKLMLFVHGIRIRET